MRKLFDLKNSGQTQCFRKIIPRKTFTLKNAAIANCANMRGRLVPCVVLAGNENHDDESAHIFDDNSNNDNCKLVCECTFL